MVPFHIMISIFGDQEPNLKLLLALLLKGHKGHVQSLNESRSQKEEGPNSLGY
jgi:hypothetical protein